MPGRREQSAVLVRRLAGLVMPTGPKMASERDVMIPVRGGEIRVRLHTPTVSGPLPLYVFLHGGGWCVGTLDERDPRCRQVADGARCIVASVEYRLAPENQFPTPLDDCHAATLWLVEHAADFGIDSNRVAIGGESAGANLAAAVTMRLRDEGGPTICHQWLDVPGLDLTLSMPSFREVPDGHLLDEQAILDYIRGYLGPDADELAKNPLVSPLLATDFSNLPPAWIMSASHDKLRDDGQVYAERLRDAGVAVAYTQLEGHVHPSFAYTRLIPSSKDYERRAITALRQAFDSVRR